MNHASRFAARSTGSGAFGTGSDSQKKACARAGARQAAARRRERRVARIVVAPVDGSMVRASPGPVRPGRGTMSGQASGSRLEGRACRSSGSRGAGEAGWAAGRANLSGPEGPRVAREWSMGLSSRRPPGSLRSALLAGPLCHRPESFARPRTGSRLTPSAGADAPLSRVLNDERSGCLRVSGAVAPSAAGSHRLSPARR